MKNSRFVETINNLIYRCSWPMTYFSVGVKMAIKRYLWVMTFPFMRWGERRYNKIVKRSISIDEVQSSVQEFLEPSEYSKFLCVYINSSKTLLMFSIHRYDIGIRVNVVCLTRLINYSWRSAIQSALVQEVIPSSVRIYEDVHGKKIYLRLDFEPQVELITQVLKTILIRTSFLRKGELFDISVKVSGQKLDNIFASDPLYHE